LHKKGWENNIQSKYEKIAYKFLIPLYFASVKTTDGHGAEVYTDMLIKSMTPYITTQVSSHNAKKKIAESSQTPVEFLQKYDDLKMKK
jgi:hypothetical protein